MQTVTLEEALARLPALLDGLPEKQELLVTRNGRPVARIAVTPESSAAASDWPRSILDLKPMSVGRVLKPDFDRAEVWEEIFDRSE